MKIVELCPFSAGGCGVWGRVKTESQEFMKLGHQVLVLSSDLEKGTNRRVSTEETVDGVKVKRFRATNDYLDKFMSQNVVYWFNKRTLETIENYKPDIVITHLLHPHSAQLCKRIKQLRKIQPSIKFFIVPHAPFNVKRPLHLAMATALWRKFSRLDLNKFDKIISIAHWERPHLEKLVSDRKKITYIPNGLPTVFFKKPAKSHPQKRVVFLGRIAPVKNIEFIIEAAKRLPDFSFMIVGPAEEEYLKKLKEECSGVRNLKFDLGVYNAQKEIKFLDGSTIFLLPSHREAMPQVLLEALSRGTIVIASETNGSQEIISNGKTGFIFSLSNSSQGFEIIKENGFGNKKVSLAGQRQAKKYSWPLLIKGYFSP